MDLQGEKSRGSLPYRMPVHHSDRHHLHARVGEKTLIRAIDFRNPKMSFIYGDLQFLREAEHNVTGDPVQQAARKCWSTERACSDEKEIADGAFRQMRFPIEEDAIKGTCCDGFPFGQDIVQKVCGLDLRGKSAGQVPPRFGDDQGYAVTVLFW